MAILTNDDLPTITGRLGAEIAETYSDDELLAPVVVRPIEAAILRRYPTIDTTHEDVRLAAAIMVAASLLRSMPEVTQSRLGDSQLQIAAGDLGRLADQWFADAWDLLTPFEPETPADVGAFLFGRIPGRR